MMQWIFRGNFKIAQMSLLRKPQITWRGRWPQPNKNHAIFSSHVLSSHVKPRDGDAIAPFYWGEDVRRET